MTVAVIVPGILVTALGINYIWIPMGNGERSGFLVTIVLTEVMFLVMLTSFIPLSKRIPILGYMFLGHTSILCVMSWAAITLESKSKILRDAIQ